MNEISLPYHLIVPSIISAIALVIIFVKRKKLFANTKWRWIWISVTVFFGVYLLIVAGAAYTDISLELSLRKFDLNGDGFFNGAEITAEQQERMHKFIADKGRNFSFISGIFFAGIIALCIFMGGKIIDYLNKRKNIN